MSQRAIKYELNPTKSQKERLGRAAGCCRKIYNMMLDRKIEVYKKNNTNLSKYDLIKQLPFLKKDSEYQYLNDVPSQALQQKILDMDTAFTNFFEGRTDYPQFKSKKKHKDSFRIPVPCDIDFENWRVKIPKIGLIKIYRGHNKTIDPQTIHSYTISHSATDRFFISILYDAPERHKTNNGKAIGIDMGVHDFLISDNGWKVESQGFLRPELRKLRVLQRSAERKFQKGKKNEEQSHNWRKANCKVQRLHEKIRFQRMDFLQKLSTEIAEKYSIVCAEDLGIKPMLKKKKGDKGVHYSKEERIELRREKERRKNISDMGWGMFLRMLSYKCDQFIQVDRYFASSQTCSSCGYKNAAIKDLNIRQWTCPSCGKHHDRDVNAALNIKREGLSLLERKVSLEG